MNEEQSSNITKELLGINKKIIFNHGNFEKRKNQHSLIKSFLLSDLNKEYDLVLLGSPRSDRDIEYFNMCLRMKDKYDKTNSIKFYKGTNNKSIVNKLLCMSDVYFLPSLAEGLPLVLLEAMSAGLPWVSTPVGGVPSVFGSLNNGKVLKDISFDEKQFTEAIREVENKNSREEWEFLFTIERAGKQYEELLK
jgi:glycosyltransferase involved in cell wall biosynthesis